jgi:hypothetical protein
MENFWPNALPSGAIAPLFNTGGLLNTLTVYGVVASRRLHSWLVRCGKDIRRQGGYSGGYSRGGDGGGVKKKHIQLLSALCVEDLMRSLIDVSLNASLGGRGGEGGDGG